MEDFVVGIDSSTTATKCVAWTKDGTVLAEGRAPVALDNPAPGRYEQNPTDWWSSLVAASKDLARHVDLSRTLAVSISNQRETIAFLDEAKVPVRPAIVWLDERCRDYVDAFAGRVGDDTIHRISGKHKDITPIVYRLAWMRECEPDNWKNVAYFTDVHAYLSFCLSGHLTTSWASADPVGCWDIVNKKWSSVILSELDLTEDRFPKAVMPGTLISEISSDAGAQTGIPPGVPVFAGGGDGQCAGLGVGVVRLGSAYINLGTAVVSGFYTAEYRWNNAWRTMTSMTGEGYIAESCLRSGTFLLNWLMDEIFREQSFADLEKAARLLPPGSENLLLLPYWSGVMNPHWDSSASGAVIGLTGGHRREHLYRAVMEGIAFEHALAANAMESQGGGSDEYCVVGGGSGSDLWCQIIADVTDKPVLRAGTAEASALGAGMIAAAGCGLYDNIVAAVDGMKGGVEARFEPDEASAKRYRDILSVYADVYSHTRTLSSRLQAANQRQNA